MTMEFGAITRGRGKIFQLIRTDCPAGHTLRATSELAGGRAMPAFVVPGRRAGERVLVLAVMAKAQRVTVELVDPAGQVVERKAETIGHAYAALQSKYNTYRKDPDALGIRNIDCRPMLEESLMDAGPLVEDGDGWVTIFCNATTYLSGDAPADTPFTITVFDQKGEAIGQGEPIVLKDAVRRPAGAQVWERRIQCSFRAPQAAPAYLAWLHYDDSAVPDGILCIEGNWANDLKGAWETRLADRPDAPGYEAWFAKYGRAGTAELARQRATAFADGPLFSIIVPLYQTPLSYFWDMVESVLAQTYGKYELVLVNASPEDAELAAAVAQAQARDPRVRPVALDGNQGITLNTNAGIRAARGDFLCFLDHDDTIEPNALFEYARAIADEPETDLLYCDEDKIQDGHYGTAFLKPDFNWDYLYNVNFVCHMLCVRRALLDPDRLPGKEMDGAQDWNLTMLVAERARHIAHVRHVLYHWRVHEQSTAGGLAAKPWVVDAQLRAVRDSLARRGIRAEVRLSDREDGLELDYAIDPEPLASIVIPNKDAVGLLDACVTSILEKTTYRNYEVVVVENNSEDPATFDFYKELEARDPRVRVVYYKGGWNFSKIVNYGFGQAQGDYLLMLNNDTEVITPEWLHLMMGPLMRDEVGITGAKLLYPNDHVQHVGVNITALGAMHTLPFLPDSDGGPFGVALVEHAVSAVTGACLLVKRSVFDAVGGLDEDFAVSYNDIDFCLKCCKLGKYVVMQPRAKLYHHESVTRGEADKNPGEAVQWFEEKALMMSRWADIYAQGDPFYNANLDRYRNAYELPR